MAAAALAVVSSFLNWTVLSSSNPERARLLASLAHESTHRDAFGSGVYAWAPLILIVVVGIVVPLLGQYRSVRRAGLPHLWLIAGLVAVALLLIGLPAMRGQFGTQAAALLTEIGVDAGAGVGRWLGLAAAVVTLVAGVLDVRALRHERSVPDKGRRSTRRR